MRLFWHTNFLVINRNMIIVKAEIAISVVKIVSTGLDFWNANLVFVAFHMAILADLGTLAANISVYCAVVNWCTT